MKKTLISLILGQAEEPEAGDFQVKCVSYDDLSYEVSLYRGGHQRCILLGHFRSLDDVIFYLWALYTGRASGGIFNLDHLPRGRVKFPQSVLDHEFENIEDRFHLEDELPARNWNHA